MWVNGRRAVRARHPNQGYLAVAEVLNTPAGGNWLEGQTRFRFKAGDLKAWASVTNAEIVVLNRWVESRLPVVSVDEQARIVTFGKRSTFKLDVGDLYWIEHVFEALDTPGEWYLDRAAGKLYYWPLPGEDLTKVEVIAPVLAQVVRLENVERVRFRGLTFAHTEWSLPTNSSGFSQAAIGVPGAVVGNGVRGATFERCTFAHLGNYGLELARGCQTNRILNCEFTDLGAGGIKVGELGVRGKLPEQTFGNEVSDCRIYDGGRLFPSAIGIWIGQSATNRLTHNLIHDFYYTGISIGWTWGYGPAAAQGNRVEGNHVHHIGVRSDGDGPILSDMGGVYTLGNQHGTIIRNNVWHDIAGLRYGGWGIYFDEGTTDALAENNLVYRTTHGGFHQHYGKDNIVRNNIFAFGRDQQLQRTRVEAHTSFIFEHNIVYWDAGKLFDGNWTDKCQFSSNLLWRTAERLETNLATSLIADPLFGDPANGNYALRFQSPAKQIGFRSFDFRAVGPRE